MGIGIDGEDIIFVVTVLRELSLDCKIDWNRGEGKKRMDVVRIVLGLTLVVEERIHGEVKWGS